MANPEHLAKLKEGVEAWNKRRKDNPEIKRDLTEADLTEIDLRKADLGYTNQENMVDATIYFLKRIRQH